jgi:hypothetical protein
MEYSCPRACTVCAQSTPVKELIVDRLVWHEPLEATASLLGVSVLDLHQHSGSDSGVSNIRSTDFPFFENSGFLFLGLSNWNTYEYLAWTRKRVRKPGRKTDKGFCILVGLIADYFLQKSNFETFLDYSDYFAVAQKLVANAKAEKITEKDLLSDDGLNSLPDQWLMTHDQPGRGLANFSQDWERLRIYGHGAVTLHQIAVLADKEISGEGIRLLYTDEAKLRWARRAYWAWLRLRFWSERIIPVMRTKKRIDIGYHAMRTSQPSTPPQAARLGREIKKLEQRKKTCGNLVPEDSRRLEEARKEIDGVFNQSFNQSSDLAQWASTEIDRQLKPLIHSRKYEKSPLKPDEIASVANMAVGNAVVKDRENTPWKDSHLKLWRDFEPSKPKPAPIIVRIRRDISDQIRHEFCERKVARGLSRHAMRDVVAGNVICVIEQLADFLRASSEASKSGNNLRSPVKATGTPSRASASSRRRSSARVAPTARDFYR